MAHFAKLDDNNIVLEVHLVSNAALDNINEESSGIVFLIEWSNGYSNWKQTSYNAATNGFRKNYAGIGYKYDEKRDAFIPPKAFDSWLLDEETCQWQAPIEYPNDDKFYRWDENTISWVEITALGK
jgi:hypothetical protein